MNASNVLRLDTAKEQIAYRRAVSEILHNIKRDLDCTWVDIAERLDVSVGTISNAEKQLNDLNGMYLMRIAGRYGAGYLNPILATANAKVVELDAPEAADLMPLVTGVAFDLAEARDPKGMGGEKIVPQEMSKMLPRLKRLNKQIPCVIREFEEALA